MLRFAPDASCRIFRLELALVLSQASHWSDVSRIDVTMLELAERIGTPRPGRAWDLAVELEVSTCNPVDRLALAGYLARNLSSEYPVFNHADRVRVEWDAARRATAPAPALDRAPSAPV